MVTKEQVKNGIIAYADNEVLPHLPTTGKWGVGAFLFIAAQRYECLFDELMNFAPVKMLGIITDSGLIDLDTLYSALKQSASKYGNLQVAIPIVGVLTFSEKDIDKMKDYICGGQTSNENRDNRMPEERSYR